MIQAKIYHWYLGYKNDYANDGELVTISNLQEWIADHGGAVVVHPPSVTGEEHWQLIITDRTNRFGQK